MNSEFRTHTSEFLTVFAAILLQLALHARGLGQDIVYRGDPQETGARGTALGGSLVSDIRDIEGLYDNPASLSELSFPGLNASLHHDWNEGIFNGGMSLRAFSNDMNSLGLGFRLTDAGTLAPKRHLDFRQYAGDVGYSFNVLTDLSMGVLAGARMGVASGETKSGYLISLGLMYTPTPSVRYGLVVRNMGKYLQYTFDPLNGVTSAAPVTARPGSVEMGSTFLFPSETRAPFVQFSISVERDYILKELRYKGGMELTLWQFLAARVGYVSAATAQVTGGLGVTLGRFQFDYAVMPRPQAPRYDEISVKAFF